MKRKEWLNMCYRIEENREKGGEMELEIEDMKGSGS